MLERMVSYAQSGGCRWKLLLDHLQALPEGFERCRHCDNCHASRDVVPDPVAAEQITTVTPMFTVGETVKVRRFARGVVAAADALSVTVAFSGAEQRSFVPQFVSATRRIAQPASIPTA